MSKLPVITGDAAPAAPLIDPKLFGLMRVAYTINETSALLSQGRSTTYKLSRQGVLPVRKIGEKSVILAVDIARLLAHIQAAPRVNSLKGAKMRRARFGISPTDAPLEPESTQPKPRKRRRLRKQPTSSLIAAE
jgi:hypothetical protein